MIETANLTDAALADYDFILLQALANRQHLSALAVRIWNDVLVKLGKRGLTEALEGSLENVTTARIRRSCPLLSLE